MLMPISQTNGGGADPKRVDLLALSEPNRFLLIAPDTIQYGVAEGNYTRLYLTDGRTHLASLKIKDVVAVLALWPAFVRIHHSHFINVRYLQYIDTQDGWIAFMVGDTALTISNARKKGLMAVFYRLYGRINP